MVRTLKLVGPDLHAPAITINQAVAVSWRTRPLAATELVNQSELLGALHQPKNSGHGWHTSY